MSLGQFVLFAAYDGYTTNLPLEASDDEEVLLALTWSGTPLTIDHGRPAWVIVPKRYAWKGAKWIQDITISDRDQKGCWEVRGCSNAEFPCENDQG